MFIKKIKNHFLSPRIFIYALLAIISAYFMYHYAPEVEKRANRRHCPVAPSQKYESISSTNDKMPMILIFAESQDSDRFDDIIREAAGFGGRCAVMLITTDGSEFGVDGFDISQRPCAILIDGDNQELGRVVGDNITFEDLDRLQQTLPENK